MTRSRDEIRIENRRKKLREVWGSTEWKKKKAEFVAGKVCSVCGTTDKLTVHHPTDDMYAKNYMDFSGCVVMCTSCHWKLHHGYKLCPVCKQRFTKHDVCWDCLPDSTKEEKEIRKVKMRVLRRKLEKEARKKYQEKLKKR